MEQRVAVARAEAGNERTRAIRRLRTERLLSGASPFLLLAVWEAGGRLGIIDVRFFPAPSFILGTFAELIVSGELFIHLATTLKSLLAGFFVGALAGVVIGLIMGLSWWVRAFLDPLVSALYPIPRSAIVPLIMLVFGIGWVSSAVLVAISVFFLVLINTMAGVMHIDRIFLDVGKNFGAGPLRMFLTIALPGALPMIFAGLRLGLGIALIVIVVAEFAGAAGGLQGIGVLIWQSWQTFLVERMYVGLVVIALLGYASGLLVDGIERLVIRWKKTQF